MVGLEREKVSGSTIQWMIYHGRDGGLAVLVQSGGSSSFLSLWRKQWTENQSAGGL